MSPLSPHIITRGEKSIMSPSIHTDGEDAALLLYLKMIDQSQWAVK